MTTLTPYYSLVLYNSSTDASANFFTWRLAIDGDASSSNFYLVDTALHNIQTQVTTLQGLSTIIPVAATFSSGTLYTATGITAISSYVNNTVIMLSLDVANTGTTTLNINSLGVKTLIKKDSSGNTANLGANDLGKNRFYFFRYDSGSTSWVWVSGTSIDQISAIGGTSGNVVTIGSDGYLSGATTQSLLISNTIHAAAGKTTPDDTDEMSLTDNTSSFSLKKVTIANLKILFNQLASSFSLTANTTDTISATTNNWSPPSISTTFLIKVITNDTTTRTITGLTGGANGRIVRIINVGTSGVNGSISLAHNNGGSTSSNRFYFSDLNAKILGFNDSITLQWDSTTSKWIPFSNDHTINHSHFNGGNDGGTLAQNQTHDSPDTDSGLTAIHHTLGFTAFQSPTGDHNHGSAGGASVDYNNISNAPAFTGITLQGAAASFSPADATTYYWGGFPSEIPTTTADRARIIIPVAGVITYTRVWWQEYGGVAGSNENITMNLRLNNTTSTLIQTVGTTNAAKNFTNGNIGITVVQGDRIEVEMVCPTWATNPTLVRMNIVFAINTA